MFDFNSNSEKKYRIEYRTSDISDCTLGMIYGDIR